VGEWVRVGNAHDRFAHCFGLGDLDELQKKGLKVGATANGWLHYALLVVGVDA
jgi:hypothetical protein